MTDQSHYTERPFPCQPQRAKPPFSHMSHPACDICQQLLKLIDAPFCTLYNLPCCIDLHRFILFYEAFG